MGGFPSLHSHSSICYLQTLMMAILTGPNSLYFDLHFSNSDIIFSCMCFLEKCQLSSSAHFLSCFLILSYMSCMYILEINPLWVASFEDISFQSVDYFCLVQNMSLYFNVRNVYLLYDKILPTIHLIQSKLLRSLSIKSLALA